MRRPAFLALVVLAAPVMLAAGALIERDMPATGHQWPPPAIWWAGLTLMLGVWGTTAWQARSWSDVRRVTLAQAAAALALAAVTGNLDTGADAALSVLARAGIWLGFLIAYYLLIWLGPVALGFLLARRVRRTVREVVV